MADAIDPKAREMATKALVLIDAHLKECVRTNSRVERTLSLLFTHLWSAAGIIITMLGSLIWFLAARSFPL